MLFYTYHRETATAQNRRIARLLAMLTAIYIEALLVDEKLADQVWKAWDAGEINDAVAAWAWWTIAASI